MKRKVLFISWANACADAYGSQMRAREVVEALEQSFEVSYAFIHPEADAWPGASSSELRRLHARFDGRCFHFVARRHRRPGIVDAALASFDQRRLASLARSHDAVWVHGTYTATLARLSHPHSVIDFDDVLSQLARSEMNDARSAIAKTTAFGKHLGWRAQESLLLRRYSFATVCSDNDVAYLGSLGSLGSRGSLSATSRLRVLPNVFPEVAATPLALDGPPVLGFVGTLSYAPNVEGVRWFMTHVWPRVRSAVPNAELSVVGQGGEAALGSFASEGVRILGRVENITTEIDRWSASVVPLRRGAGTRVKIAETFARLRPAVSTRLGAHGYPLVSGREIFLADEPGAFAAHCITLLRDRELGRAMAERAHALYMRDYTPVRMRASVRAIANELFASA